MALTASSYQGLMQQQGLSQQHTRRQEQMASSAFGQAGLAMATDWSNAFSYVQPSTAFNGSVASDTMKVSEKKKQKMGGEAFLSELRHEVDEWLGKGW